MAAERVLTPLADASNSTYDPQPFGLIHAREAVAAYYAARGAPVSPHSIVLTASTSEAYSYLLRLFCDVGDEVLIASPSYPLLDVLADLNDVKLVHYPLFYDHGWHVDSGGLEKLVSARTRAIVVIHPNNPTGHYTGVGERRFLEALCAQHNLALIVDEVFLDYSLGEDVGSFACGAHSVLTVVLSGLSKVAGLGQMKVAWMVVDGPGAVEALGRLEVIADSYLSVSAPAQNALPGWLEAGEMVRDGIRTRVTANLRALDEMLAGQCLVSRLQVDAGWYVILRLPDLAEDKELAARLVEERGVLTQPGELFGMAGRGQLVVSLLPEREVFDAGLREIVEFATALPESPRS
jgi:aspartate/methionine/tyrosine aminotransferase